MVQRRGFLFGLLATFIVACRNKIGGVEVPAPSPQCAPGTVPVGQAGALSGRSKGGAGFGYLVTRDGQCVQTPAQPQPTVGGTPLSPTTPIDVGTGNLKGLKVTLDVGHGVSESPLFDKGVVNEPRGLVEYELNRQEAFLVAEKLRSKGAQVKVNDYKAGSPHLTLSKKGQAAGDANVFVSIHHNGVKSPSAQGTEVLYHPQGSSSDRKLAALIQKHMVKHIWKGSAGSKDRGAKSMRLGVLGGVPKGVSACCLTEAFFLTGSDASKSTADTWVKAAAQGLVDGIEEYWSNRSMSLYSSEEEWPAEAFPEDPDPEGLYVGH